ncbi:MAG: hypothetical protein KBG15_11530, partial [Kofleriaceae bacterium]|nr:hypothetical protein [Kofleriaceae bacterium]
MLKFGRLRFAAAVGVVLTVATAWAALSIGRLPLAWAAPEVEIKAQSLLQLGEVRKIGANRVQVTGTFLDRITGAGISNAKVTVSLGTASAPVTTGPSGEFSIELPAPDGELPVGLYFAGSTVIDPTSAETVTDPARSPTTLHINATATTTGAD